MARLVPISDPTDRRLESYRHLRERDLVGREGHFIAEGEVVLRVLASAPRFPLRSCLIAENRLAAITDCLAPLPDEVEVFVAPRPVLEAVAGFDVHRGVLALGSRPDPEPLVTMLSRIGERATVLVALGIANHDNMGGLFRNAAAFGVDALLLDHASCDPLYRKAIRVSVGGVFRVPFMRAAASTTADPFGSDLELLGFERVALSPRAPLPLEAYQRPGRVAVYVGAEGAGLAAEVLVGTRALSIPMRDGFDSLNVATSAAIALYHLARGVPTAAAAP